jgi:cytochrome c biogenesis protein CcdA
MILIENYFGVEAVQRSIPTLVIGEQIFIGETEIRDNFTKLVNAGIQKGGIPFPSIEGINPSTLLSVEPDVDPEGEEGCDESEEVCIVEAPIYIAYFYQTGCKECSRVEADLNYLRSKYPQMQIDEFNIYEEQGRYDWMVERVNPDGELLSPAVFIGDYVLMGEDLLPEKISEVLEEYRISGSERYWDDYNEEEGEQLVTERFKNMSWVTVLAAGLIDGINPCAFATLIFFVSYLTLSGRTGKEVLFVGGAFTLGVFLAYLAVGLGLYQAIEWVMQRASKTLDLITNIVYFITGVVCITLAVISFIDYRKAKKGNVGDMMLKLPEPLRKRINATIRLGRKSRNYALGAFGVGILISFLELACTGQVYLPTIIVVSSVPELRLRAILYLVLYNLLFILPLVIIFVLVYFGTTSKQLTQFMQKHAAAVKFAMGIIFIFLSSWLIYSLVS